MCSLTELLIFGVLGFCMSRFSKNMILLFKLLLVIDHADASSSVSSSSQIYPNYQGCIDEISQSLPYCDTSKTIDERVEALVSSLNLTEKASRMYSCRESCDTCPCAIPRVGLPPYAYLVEVNTDVAAP